MFNFSRGNACVSQSNCLSCITDSTGASQRLGSLNLQHEVQVIRNVSQTIILGWDFLQQHFAVLDLGRGLCHLHNQDLPLLSTTEMTPDSCSAHVTECTAIPPSARLQMT